MCASWRRLAQARRPGESLGPIATRGRGTRPRVKRAISTRSNTANLVFYGVPAQAGDGWGKPDAQVKALYP